MLTIINPEFSFFERMYSEYPESSKHKGKQTGN